MAPAVSVWAGDGLSVGQPGSVVPGSGSEGVGSGSGLVVAGAVVAGPLSVGSGLPGSVGSVEPPGSGEPESVGDGAGEPEDVGSVGQVGFGPMMMPSLGLPGPPTGCVG
ncbi:hypothetical protein [Streptomyces sp. NBC_01320]|uniref:hypothetical protein n=1 Tax=Streptomyces sp. NBC_01320 TaxID=2903824 RepID=UPI002E0FA827|nr:hypothetical protein OG395_13495 [Streptomyces sp. NBC_01320]